MNSSTPIENSRFARPEIVIGTFLLAIAVVVTLALVFVGIFGLIVPGVWAAVLFCILVLQHKAIETMHEIMKQIAVWLGIVSLLPLVVWYGTSTFFKSPETKENEKAKERIEERLRESSNDSDKAAEREKLRNERDKLTDKLEEAARIFHRNMFWVAFPLGMGAFVVGIFVRVQAVGSGLMFGGISALTAGCYSYWDEMTDGLRFGFLLVALAGVIVLGLWRFRPTKVGLPPTPIATA